MVGLHKINHLIRREMSRAELLRYAVIALLCLMGIAGMMQNFSRAASGPSTHTSSQNSYGQGVYGR